MGKTVGPEDIQCPYHRPSLQPARALRRDATQETLNPSAMVPSFPIVDRYRYAWVWLGDPALADAARIPDMQQMTDPLGGRRHDPRRDYQLVLDNLMDLTHEEFVHASSIGQKLSESEFVTTHTDTTVTVERWMLGIEARRRSG